MIYYVYRGVNRSVFYSYVGLSIYNLLQTNVIHIWKPKDTINTVFCLLSLNYLMLISAVSSIYREKSREFGLFDSTRYQIFVIDVTTNCLFKGILDVLFSPTKVL